MSTDQMEINKAAVKRFADAANTHDPGRISKAVDEVFDPNWRAGWQMPIEANGPQDRQLGAVPASPWQPGIDAARDLGSEPQPASLA